MNEEAKRLGNLLLENGLITQEQLEHVLKTQKFTGKKIGEIFIEEGILSENQIIEVLEFQFGIPHMDLNKYFIDPEIPRLISERLARRYTLIPVKKDGERLIVAMADPLNIFAIDDIKIATGLEIVPAIATNQGILDAIDQHYETESAERALAEFKRNYQVENINDIDKKILSEISNAPVVKLVNSIIRQAIKMKASDIHIEPFEKIIKIRLRIDGDLQEVMAPAKTTHSAIVTRIKIIGKMDIAEKRLPQDGRVEMNIEGKEIDLRISTLPTIHGEKIVMRLLDRSSFLFTKQQLGFTAQDLEAFNKVIQSPNGIILVTGPTGSGKTTTLYTILGELNRVDKNIITVEDPVEYQMDGINQVQVNVKAGLTFANGLRSILRQDPDIIMIGEIRDSETAQIAVRAAITGHLVLSTLHTNDTASSITRLVDMGIDPYLVSSSVVGITAQRLVKKICENCKIGYTADKLEKKVLQIEDTAEITVFRGRGCNFCNNTGYKGRMAIHEILPVTKDIRLLIDRGFGVDKIKEEAEKQNFVSLRENCIQLVKGGITTIEELLRTTYSI
ncbi:MAG: GspE/PulE family protein [Candidatus Alkaliphilus sp. MAG34]|nr:Flp pilus assembly complex ATPase component TadA [Clostridiales bacterium]